MTVHTGPHPVPAVGPYRLQRLLGEGGMGVVHLALDPQGRPVAVKVLRPHLAVDPDVRRRLGREVATMQRVRGPHVARVLDADVDGPQPYIVTDFVPGRSLDDIVRRGGPLSLTQLLGLGAGLADALSCVHRAGVVHRDLKPGNVIVDAGRPVVIDFGIAQLADDVRLTMTGSFFGTPGYLAPEVVRGDRASAASDVASWAAAMCFAASGRPPYGTGPVEVVLGRIADGRLDLSGLPKQLRPIVAAAIDVPWRRPPAHVLRGWLTDLASRTPDTTLLTEPHGGAVPGSTYLLTRRAETLTPPAPSRQQAAPLVPPPDPAPQPERAPLPAAGQPPAPELRRSHRLGGSALDLALSATVGGVLALAPVIGALLAVLSLLVLLAGARAARQVERRRAGRGRRASDPVAVTAALPWHLVRSLPATLATAGGGALLGAAVVGVGLLAAGRSQLETTSLVAAAAGTAGAWWGPRHRVRREATDRLAAIMGPASTVVAVLAFAVAAAVVWWVAAHSALDWFPTSGSGPSGTVSGILSRVDSA